MSVRLTRANAQKLSRASAPDYNSAYTFLLAYRPASVGTRQVLGGLRLNIGNFDALRLNEAFGNILQFHQSVAASEETVQGATVLSAGTWYYIAMVRHSATSVELFIGTTPDNMASDTGGPATLSTVSGRSAATGLDIGTISTSVNYLDGRVRYGRLYTSALSLADIKAAAGAPWAEWLLPSAGSYDDTSGNTRPLTATGTPSTEADDAVTWPETSGSTGSGSPTKTLVVSAVGTALADSARRAIISFIELEAPAALGFTGSGSPTKTLAASASAVASQAFVGSGAPTTSLAVTASGQAVQADHIGVGAPTVTLVASAVGEGTSSPDVNAGDGAPVVILSASGSGVATQTFSGSGAPIVTLATSASGVATRSGFAGPVFALAANPVVSQGDRIFTWPANHIPGDIALLFIETANEPVVTITANGGGTPSVFAEVPGIDHSSIATPGALNATRLSLYWCRATSNNMSSITVTDVGDHILGQIQVYRGCVATGNPWDIITSETDDTGDTEVLIPGGTTTVNNCLIVGVITNVLDIPGADPPAVAEVTNASLENVSVRANFNFAGGNGGGIAVITGEKLLAGSFDPFVGTFNQTTRSAAASIALRPNPVPLIPATGSGAPSATLVVSAAAVATQTFAGAGAPTKTLESVVAGVAVQRFTGAGAPIVSLNASAIGVATRARDVMSTSADPTAVLHATAHGLMFSQGIPTPPGRPPGRGKGRPPPKHTYYIVPEEEPKKRKRKRRRTPKPAIEVVELPALPPPTAPIERYNFDPMLWQSLAMQVRPEIPVMPQVEIDEEEAFLRHILETI